MNRCCGTRCCYCPWYWSMPVHKFSIDFVWMRISADVSMNQTIANCVVARGYVALEMMHCDVSMILHKWLCHWDYLRQSKIKMENLEWHSLPRDPESYLHKWHQPNSFECIDVLDLHHVRSIFHHINCARPRYWSWASFSHRTVEYSPHNDLHILVGSWVVIDFVGAYRTKFWLIHKFIVIWSIRVLTLASQWNILSPFDRFSVPASAEPNCRRSFRCLVAAYAKTCRQIMGIVSDMFTIGATADADDAADSLRQISQITHTYRTDNFTRIFSMVADCPCEVKSMMTSQRASGNGVNCPWTVGVTMQSSISPVCFFSPIARMRKKMKETKK